MVTIELHLHDSSWYLELAWLMRRHHALVRVILMVVVLAYMLLYTLSGLQPVVVVATQCCADMFEIVFC